MEACYHAKLRSKHYPLGIISFTCKNLTQSRPTEQLTWLQM